MNKTLTLFVAVFVVLKVSAQEFPQKKYSVGVQGGGAALEFLEPWGFNYQINLERNYKTGVSLGLSLGSFQFNTFPDFWESDGVVNEISGVPPAVFEYIQDNYSAREVVFGLDYSAYRVNYYQTFIAYTIPVEVFRTRLRVKSGLSYLHWTYHEFVITSATANSFGRIESFTPLFELGSKGLLGWNLGGGLERRLTPDFHFIADFSYQLPLGFEQNLNGFVTILAGFRYGFGEE